MRMDHHPGYLRRYLELLQEGAAHWRLDPAYVAWLSSLPSVDSRQRGAAYYTSVDGTALEALPKIRTGSQPTRGPRGGRGQRQQGRQAAGGGHSGRGRGRAGG